MRFVDANLRFRVELRYGQLLTPTELRMWRAQAEFRDSGVRLGAPVVPFCIFFGGRVPLLK